MKDYIKLSYSIKNPNTSSDIFNEIIAFIPKDSGEFNIRLLNSYITTLNSDPAINRILLHNHSGIGHLIEYNNDKVYDNTIMLIKNEHHIFNTSEWYSSNSPEGVYLDPKISKYGYTLNINDPGLGAVSKEAFSPPQKVIKSEDLKIVSVADSSMMKCFGIPYTLYDELELDDKVDILFVNAGVLNNDINDQRQAFLRNAGAMESLYRTNPKVKFIVLGSTSIFRGFPGKEAYVNTHRKLDDYLSKFNNDHKYLVLPSISSRMTDYNGYDAYLLGDTIRDCIFQTVINI